MTKGNQHPTLLPSPLPLLDLKEFDYLDYPCILSIMPCPFCCRLFEPAWDYKIVSIGMLIIDGMPLIIFLILLSVCLRVVGKKCI